MSNSVFPTLPGIGWSVMKTPMWSTALQAATSGREVRVGLRSSPLYKFAMTFNFLRSDASWAELQALMAFYNARNGMYDSFLFTDATDSAVTAQVFGSGNGSTAFQLTRSYGGYSEAVCNLNGAPLIYINSVLKTVTTDYTLSSAGVVTFTTPPAGGASLTWTGGYYYRCRFFSDSLEHEQFMNTLWTVKKCELLGALTNKI